MVVQIKSIASTYQKQIGKSETRRLEDSIESALSRANIAYTKHGYYGVSITYHVSYKDETKARSVVGHL